MKRIAIFLCWLAAFCFFTSGAFAVGVISPSTNALVFSTRFGPELPPGVSNFGIRVAARSNVVVFGNSVSRDSTTNILGTVYRREGTNLAREFVLPAPAVTNLEVLDIATDGKRIAVATAEGEQGKVHVFLRSENAWAPEVIFHTPARVRSVGVSGTTIVMAGSEVFVFEQGTNGWIQSTLPQPSEAMGFFGTAVAIDGDRILVGEANDPRDPRDGGYPGSAFVFVRTAEGWKQEAQLLAENYLLVSVGNAVALGGDIALLSAEPGRFDSGFVYAYERIDGAWRKLGTLSGNQGHDFFGRSVAVSGRNMIVGAPSERGGAGAVFVFRWDGAITRKHMMYFDEFTGGGAGGLGSFMGYEVAADGEAVIAGAPYHSNNGEREGFGAFFILDFPETLHAPAIRFEERKFRFLLSDAEAGARYVLEKKGFLGEADWSEVKEIEANGSEVEVETELSLEAASGFYRLRRLE